MNPKKRITAFLSMLAGITLTFAGLFSGEGPLILFGSAIWIFTLVLSE